MVILVQFLRCEIFMKFNNEQEKQAFIDNLKQMVAEITKVEPYPGYTIEKNCVEIAQFCLKLEDMIKVVADSKVKIEIIRALRVVEAFYEEHLDRRIKMPFVQYVECSWYIKNIDLLQKSLDNLNHYAPTARTCELYCAFVDEYSQLLQNLLDSKTPGHPACVAHYQEELRTTLAAGRALARRSNSPVNMMLPRNPNEPDNNTHAIVIFAPGSTGVADMPFEDFIDEDASQSRDRTFSQ